jgi:hypothetical protein
MDNDVVWIVQWQDAAGEKASEKNNGVAFFLPAYMSENDVRSAVEGAFLLHAVVPADSLKYATGGPNPYPARIHAVQSGGFRIECGYHPWLEAKKVRNVRHVLDRKFVWDTI